VPPFLEHKVTNIDRTSPDWAGRTLLGVDSRSCAASLWADAAFHRQRWSHLQLYASVHGVDRIGMVTWAP